MAFSPGPAGHAGPGVPAGDDGWVDVDVEDIAVLHDAAYLYAFRRSLSGRLASAAAREAVRSLGAGSRALASEGDRHAEDDGRVRVLLSARTALERYLPPALPPRVDRDPALQSALAALSPTEREFLLLRHWDGLTPGEAARATSHDADHLSTLEAALARLVSFPGGPEHGAAGAPVAPVGTVGPEHSPLDVLITRLRAADPATAVRAADLAASRRGATPEPVAAPSPPRIGVESPLPTRPEQPRTSMYPDDDTAPPVPADGSRGRRARTAVGIVCLLVLVAALAALLVPRSSPGPAAGVERLYSLADVVAIVSDSAIRPTDVDGEMRILQHSVVVQIVKGEADDEALTVDVTGRSTLERPYTRNFFPPNQLLFLVRDGDGVLSPIEGEDSVLTLVDRRTPEARTTSGDPAPLPEELRNAIDAVPGPEFALAVSGREPGALDPADIVGIRPADGRDAQNLPADQLGTFRMAVEDGRACAWFEFNGRSAVLRWPEGFTAYAREEYLPSREDDQEVRRRVLTILNERGYPYVDENRSTPFIRGVPTGERATCGGQELDVWDIAVAPGSTLLFY